MPRTGRKHSGTGIYHVMLRGINRQDIFAGKVNTESPVRRTILIVYCLCHTLLVHTQTPTDSLYIDSININYCIESPLVLTYTNESKTPLYVTVSLEGKNDNKDWHLIYEDIFMEYRFEQSQINNSIEIIPMHPNALGSSNSLTPIINKRTDIWMVDKRLLELYGIDKTFRLKYTVGTHSHYTIPVKEKELVKEKILYSPPFNIESAGQVFDSSPQ